MARLVLLALAAVAVMMVCILATFDTDDGWRVIGDDGEEPGPGVKPGP